MVDHAPLSLKLAKLAKPELELLRGELERQRTEDAKRNQLYRLFPDEGPLRRELYPKHMRFFALGGQHEPGAGCGEDCSGSAHNERALIAANRIGKTTTAAYEVACQMTGYYPPWWTGRRFSRPICAWAVGPDAKSMRDSVQPALLGPVGAIGTGLIPGDLIIDRTARPGVPDAVDTVSIKHESGMSRLVFKTCDQGRESFQGATVDVMWFDEEPPIGIYTEGLTRTMSTVPGEPNGIMLCTFTPLLGLSQVVQSFLPGLRPPEAERKETTSTIVERARPAPPAPSLRWEFPAFVRHEQAYDPCAYSSRLN